MYVTYISVKASELLGRARGLADLVNSKFITHEDEKSSLNESYRDVYADITDNNDDYYLKESVIALSSTMKVAGSDNEYHVPLPEDFWKLRYADFQGTSRYHRMNRFPWSAKNNLTGEPMYRFWGAYLWLIVGNLSSFSGSIKIGYYPKPDTLTVPDAEIPYGASLTYAQRALVSSPFYWNADGSRSLLYIYNSTGINVESNRSKTTVVLITGLATAATNLIYYKGYVYWLRAGDIWRAASDLTGTITPVQITSVGNITNFTIWNDKIYFCNGTLTRYCNLDGSGTTTIAAFVSDDICFLGSTLVYRTAAGALRTQTDVILASGVSHVVSDGVYLYIVDTSKQLRRLTVETTGWTVTADDLMDVDINYIGNTAAAFISMIPDETWEILAQSTDIDSELDYPLNALYEVMAYQMASDFKRKQNADPALIENRLVALKDTLLRQMRRDEYQVERIRNHYGDTALWSW